MTEPGQATVDEVLHGGEGICSGYVPGTVPGQYMEVWEYQSYVYMLIPQEGEKPTVIHALGTRWK